MGSADWMPRNFFRRIEVVFPIKDGNLRERLISEILRVTLADNAKARILGADGVYRAAEIPAGKTPRRSQMEFIALATPQITSKTKDKFPRVKIRTATAQN